MLVPCTSTEFRTNKPSDVISTLVSIYDSKDLFVKELQVLLAQRLLAITKDNSDRVEREVFFFFLDCSHFCPLHNSLLVQRRNVEILKIRFGEAALQVCEVMLKDMTDSKRIDGHVQSQKAVCPFKKDACPSLSLTKLNCSVHRPSHHHFATLLAHSRVERFSHAWSIQ